ncbi:MULTISPECIES: ECF transporter S component [Bacillaceae]|uniref:Riboflavin transporter n=1 Tax=Gottfriedia luciferensis TaxID=178774 RepID=A0ABX3A2Y4_9BACI|nr:MULTISPECIES: ECF transporter S component [Bacillaceae]ODG93648.1 riboflavin transporter FmnP [Gottfriedia luciferensis]PGZ91083.1 ECF transporter S component [Bacillus sp. AFS029533]
MQQRNKVNKMVIVAMLSSISYVLMMLYFPLPAFPVWLTIDFSDVPALIGAIVFGPVAGIGIELIKNILHYVINGSMTGVPIGEFANFSAGVLYILPASYFFRKYRSVRGLTLGLIVGTVVMTGILSLLNYFVLLPAYAHFMNFNLPNEVIVASIMPFNAIKGLLIMILFLVIYPKLKVWLTQRMNVHNV